MLTKMEKIQSRIPKWIKESIDEECEYNSESRSSFVRKALEFYIKKKCVYTYDKKRGNRRD